ncbi:MAG: sulfatase [Verrucomicrobiota bacterium JB024]|nr:sulfatase [Verrucomicrobiota bacterium JB024]
MTVMLAAMSLPAYAQDDQSGDRPNFVFIMIDDLGYGDVGCYGSTVSSTPHIDELANSGMLFTDFHSNGPMCSPTRASLMTGLYQYRFGEKFDRALGPGDDGLPLQAVTIAEALKKQGYATAIFGKWHLGDDPEFSPVHQGFDEFVGLVSGDGDHFTHIDRQGEKDWWHNDQLQMDAGYTTDLITDQSIRFIQKHKNEPFFLYVSHLAIHFPWQGPEDPPQRKEGVDYKDDKWGIIPDRNNVSPHVKAMIEAVDGSIEKIMAAIDEAGIANNTLVIFTSDNGGYTHYADNFFNISSNAPLRGQKTEIYEGGHRVPFIAVWPGKIPAGTTSDELAMSMDILPTFMELVQTGNDEKLPSDGRSIVSSLLNAQSLPERIVFWKIGDSMAVRSGKWKLCVVDGGPPELYDLSVDIGETTNLASAHPQKAQQLLKAYENWKSDLELN